VTIPGTPPPALIPTLTETMTFVSDPQLNIIPALRPDTSTTLTLSESAGIGDSVSVFSVGGEDKISTTASNASPTFSKELTVFFTNSLMGSGGFVAVTGVFGG